MNRREFLLAAPIAVARLKARASPGSERERSQSLTSEGWRIFDVTTHVHVQNPSGTTRVWLPAPIVGAPYQQTLGDTYNAEHGRVVMVESEELDLLLAEWTDAADPVLELTSRVATRPYAVDLAKPVVEPPADFAAFARFLRPTKLHAVDGAVKKLAMDVTRGAGTDIDRARAIFEWLVRGGATVCGLAGPQCSDRSTLFTALARAAGIPARVLFGLRLAAADATKAHHTRSEVYLTGFGWAPLDPTSGTFGSWDGNWIAFNMAQDVPLPKSKHGVLPFFMHPQAESANGFANALDAAAFRYDIRVRESA
ncbi:MAG TPA: transglutaminase-like domain-containing protein [Vicinamibacterales bacterium]|nr:transglutaminase-like domain-containing protein [Vicinamibacterales bacterium]